jgi:hypothetical protein
VLALGRPQYEFLFDVVADQHERANLKQTNTPPNWRG